MRRTSGIANDATSISTGFSIALDPQPGDLALDVGCGKGSYHPLLIARGVRAILGVDASPAMVMATQHQANTRGLPVVSIESNAERLPVPDASYDLTWLTTCYS